MRNRFPHDLTGVTLTALDDLRANFEKPGDQGPRAYAEQILLDHPDIERTVALADAVLAVEAFHARVSTRS